MIEKIISGGQTGADQIGLTVAQHLKIKTGGCAPKDFMTETGPCESLKTLFGLREVTTEETAEFAKLTGKSDRYTARTYINARDSDGTVYFAANPNSPGSKTTKRGCNEYKKPFIMNPDVGQLVEFIRKNRIRILNVAGNRESKLSSAYAKEIGKTLEEAVREVINPKNSLI